MSEKLQNRIQCSSKVTAALLVLATTATTAQQIACNQPQAIKADEKSLEATKIEPKTEPARRAYTSSNELPTRNPIMHPITGPHVPEGTFPMKRGEKQINILDDGTSIETLDDSNGDFVIYTVLNDAKIKFANPSQEQIDQILAAKSFKELKGLSTQFLEEEYRAAIAAEQGQYKTAMRKLLLANDIKHDLRILEEGPIDECQHIRYRRGMSINPYIGTMHFAECLWKERTIDCPDRSGERFQNAVWLATIEEGQFKIWDGDETNYIAPTPTEWLSVQPECPRNASKYSPDYPDLHIKGTDTEPQSGTPSPL